jgi:prepilin-type N-terminal cleavage/methylation domain-containing protein
MEASVVGRVEDERGFTLIELLIAMFVLSIVTAVFGSTLASVQSAVVREDRYSRANDQARLAMEQLDREVRSGNVLYDPADPLTGFVPYYYVRIYTQANAPTRGGYVCSIWQIDANQQLLTERWDPADPNGTSTGWRVVATGVVNRAVGEHAFQLDPDPMKGNRTLNVTLAVNADLAHGPTQTVRLNAALTGRNTSYGYPVSICSTLPS